MSILSKRNIYKPIYITTKNFFIVTLIVIFLTITATWIFGLGQQRKMYENSILSTTILSVVFFFFITIGLYKGVKLKDNIGKITDKIKLGNVPSISEFDVVPSQAHEFGDSIIGIFIAVLFWLLISILFILLIIFFSTIIWAILLIFAAMLYWIFFRALRLVFKNSKKCRGDLRKSIAYGFSYTIIYNFWIYGIIWLAHYIN